MHRLSVPRAALLASVLLFSVVGWRHTEVLGTWHEELSVFPNRGYEVLELTPSRDELVVREACAEGAPPWTWTRARPRLTLCAGGLAFPVLVESYFAGIFYWPSALAWPLHQGNAFWLRKLTILVGVVELLLTYALVARLRDEATAAIVSVVAAASSPFVHLHSLLVLYEVLPWLCLTIALLAIGPRSPATSRARVVGAGAALGVGMLANLKMILLVAPLALLVLMRRRDWLRAVGQRGAAAGAMAAAAVTAPFFFLIALDPREGGFEAQIRQRLAAFVAHLDPRLVPAEILNQLTFGADVGAYLSGDGTTHPLLLVPGALATAWALAQLVRWLRGRDADRLGVLCGATLLSYVFVSLLLYDQRPAANYSPISIVFGMTLGGAVAALASELGRRVPRLAPSSERLGLGIAAALALGSIAHLSWRAEVAAAMDMPINVVAERGLEDHLGQLPREATVVSTTYVLAGVVESLSGDRFRVVQAHIPLEDCLRAGGGTAVIDRCLEGRFARVIDHAGPNDVRFVLPARQAIIDPDGVDRLPISLRRVARVRGLAIEEASFESATGVAQISLIHLHARSRRAIDQGAPHPINDQP